MEYQAIETTGAIATDPRFTVSRAALLPVLELMAKSVIEKRHTLPILSNIRIDASPSGELRLMGTDLDLQIVATLSADIETPGAFTVSVFTLRDIVKSAEKGRDIGFIVSDGRVSIDHGRARQTLPTLPVDDFPTMPIETPSASFIAPDSLIGELGMIAPFVGIDERKAFLNGVLFDGTDGNLHCVATDGHTLATLRYELPDGAQDMGQAIIPSKAIKDLRAIAKASGESCPIVEISGNKITFDMGAFTLTSKLINGDPVQWRNLTPTGELSGLMLPKLDSRLPSGKVEALTKAVNAPLTWEMGFIGADNQVVALVTSAAYPHFQAIQCCTSEPVYAQGYNTDDGVTVECDGVVYPVAVKSGRIHLSAETVHALCGPVDKSTHVYIPTHTYFKGQCVAIDGVPTDAMPAGYKVNPITPKGKARYDVIIPMLDGETALDAALPDECKPIAPKYKRGTVSRANLAIQMLSGIKPGLGRRAFDNCFEMGDGKEVDAVITGILKTDEAIARMVYYGKRSYRAAYPGDYPETHYASSFLSPQWLAIIILHGIITLNCVNDTYGMRAKVAELLPQDDQEQQDDAIAPIVADEPEIAPQDQKNSLGDDLDAQPDAMAALIARMDALEAMLISATANDGVKINNPSVAIETDEPLSVKPKRTAAHIRAIMAYLTMRALRGELTSERKHNAIGMEQLDAMRADRDDWKAIAEQNTAEIDRLRALSAICDEHYRHRLDDIADLNAKRRRAILKARDFQKRLYAEHKIVDKQLAAKRELVQDIFEIAEKEKAAVAESERLRKVAYQQAGHIQTVSERLDRAEAILRAQGPSLSIVPPISLAVAA